MIRVSLPLRRVAIAMLLATAGIAHTREQTKNASDLDLRSKTFARMR